MYSLYNIQLEYSMNTGYTPSPSEASRVDGWFSDSVYLCKLIETPR